MTGLEKSSEHRIEAECPYYEDCGGCSLACLDYEGQLKLKEDQINDQMTFRGWDDPLTGSK